jgi:hypothetical protein
VAHCLRIRAFVAALVAIASTAGCGGATAAPPVTVRVYGYRYLEVAVGAPRPCRTWFAEDVVGLLCDAKHLTGSGVEYPTEQPGGVKMSGSTVRSSGASTTISQTLGSPLTPGGVLRLRAEAFASGTLLVRGMTTQRRVLSRDLLQARFDDVELHPGQRAVVRFEGTGARPRFVYEGPHGRHLADAQTAINVRTLLLTRPD